MVAIVSGIRPGLELSSPAVLGQAGATGAAAQGRNGQGVYVNVANGMLVLQNQDDYLAARGQDHAAIRTYNSSGVFNDDNGDNWASGVVSLKLLGTVNTAGTSIQRVDRDGSTATYGFDTVRNAYVTPEGAGAHDTIVHLATEGQFEWRDGATGASQRFEGSGQFRLLSSKDTSGSTLSYAYGASGFLSSVTTASGETTVYDYIGTNLSQVRTITGGVTSTRVRYGYDPSNRLASVTVDMTPTDNAVVDGKLYQTTYTYEGTSNRVATVIQSDGTSLAIGYVDVGGGTYKVASLRDGLNQAITFTYGAGHATATDAQGRVTRYDFDAAGQLTKITAPAVAGASATKQFSFNPVGDVISVTDGEGRVVAFEYDANGNQVLQRDQAGNTVARTFDARNKVLTEAVYLLPDPDGAGAAQPATPLTTRYAYDSGEHNLLRFVVTAEGRVTEHRYNGFGERTASITYAAATYAVGGLPAQAALTESQLASWSATQTLSATQRVDLAYDARGQVRTRTSYGSVGATGEGVADGSRSIEQFVYDQAGQLLQTVSPANGTTSYTHDGLGRILSSTNALGEVTLTAYDDAGRKIVVTAASGLVTTSIHDAAGRLAAVSQSSSAGAALGETKYFYDAGNRLRMTQDPTGVRNWLLYDEAGRKVADIDGNGTMTEYTYDRADQLTRSLVRGNAVDLALLVDAAGLPVFSATLAAVRPVDSAADRGIWRQYDAAGRAVREAAHTGTTDRAAVAETRYDGASRAIEVVRYATTVPADGSVGSVAPGMVPVPVPSAEDRVARNFHDGDGRLAGALDSEGYLTVFRYTPGGQISERIAYANPTAPALQDAGTLAQLVPVAAAGDMREVTLYNARGQVTGHVDAEGYLTESVYDGNGNLAQTVRYATRVTVTVSATSSLGAIRPVTNAADRSTVRTFDALDRLEQETGSDGVVTQYAYDAAGNVVSTKRAVGTAEVRTLLARHDLQGRMTGELSAEGAALLTGGQTQAQMDAIWTQYGTSHTYDAAARRTSSTDALGHRTWFFYNADGSLTHSVNALGEVRESRFDVRGRVVEEIAYATRIATTGMGGGLVTEALTTSVAAIANAARDSKTMITYTRDDRVATSTDALGTVESVTYNAFGEEASSQLVGTAVNLLETYMVDRRGQRTRTVADQIGINSITSAVLDAFGRVTRTVDASGNVREQTYDRLGRLVTARDPLNAARTSSYDAFGGVLTQTDAIGNVTKYSYDAVARTMTVTTPEAISSTTTYTRHGQIQSFRDGKAQLTSYAYDRNGNLLRTTTPLTTSSNAYDAVGLLKEDIDAGGNKVIYTYDAARRVLTRRVDPTGLNLATSYSYDAKGQRVLTTDPNGVATSTEFDRGGRVLRQTVDPTGLNLRTTYTYDARGNKLTVTSPGGTVTQYVYDALGRLRQERIDPLALNLQRSWDYDKSGNITSSKDARGSVTRYAYDAGDRLIYTIDPVGNLRQNIYDAAGRIVRTLAFATPITTATLGAVPTVAQIQPLAIGAAADQVEHRIYDKDGRVAATIDGMGGVVRYTYDANGSVVLRMTYANAISLAGWAPGTLPAPVVNSDRDARLASVYDALNRVIYTLDSVGAVVTQSYDANGNVLRRTAYATSIASGTPATQAAIAAAVAAVADGTRDASVRNTYDAAGRLTYTVNGAGAVRRRVYDRNGNTVQDIAYATPVAAAPAAASVVSGVNDRVISHTYDKANRLTVSVDALNAKVQQVYDAEGNVVRRTAYAQAVASTLDRSTRFGFDAAGRQVLTIDAEGAVVERQYDGAGNVTLQTAYANKVNAAGLASVATLASMKALVVANAAADRSTRNAYDAAGRLVFEVDSFSQARGTKYDGIGRALEVRRFLNALPGGTVIGADMVLVASALDRVEKYSYDAAGRQKTRTDARGAVESWTYDALGLKLTFSNKMGAKWTYAYDAQGRMTRETSPALVLTTVSFDETTRTLSEPAAGPAASVVTLLAYDALGNLLQRTEAAGRAEQRVTRYEYDAEGRQVRVIFPAVHVYDAASDDPMQNVELSPRRDVERTLSTETYYDAFGDAVANRDVGGGLSQKVHDRAGRLLYDVDALGYVTGYVYDAFGGATSLTRYGSQTALAARALTQASHAVSKSELDALLASAAFNHAADRTLRTVYDRLGRETEIMQPEAYVYDATLVTQAFNASARTRKTYNAFGDVVQVATARDASVSAWYVNIHYVNQLGQEVAVVDAQGYLTTRSYDILGNLKDVKEYANALPVGSWTSLSYGALPASAAEDRATLYEYDVLDRKTAETRVRVEYSSVPNATSMTGNLVTRYGYDALGNQTSVTDAAGNVTWTYYDVLGRVRAVAAPFSGSTKTLTVFRRDAHGNVVVKLEHATPVTATATNHPTVPFGGTDRRALTRYDVLGRATEVSDANDAVIFSSFDAQGRVAKTWRAVTDAGGTTRTQFQVNVHDALGQLVETRTPASTTLVQGGGVQSAYTPAVPVVLGEGLLAPHKVVLAWSDVIDVQGGNVRVEVDHKAPPTMAYDEATGWLVATDEGLISTTAVDLSAAVAAGGAEVTWEQDTERVTYIRVYQFVSGQWTVKWEGSMANAKGSGVNVLSQAEAGLVVDAQEFNAFGELTRKGTQGGRQEYFDYDNAGRLWRTNSGDGVDRIQLYDLQGNVTSEIRSSGAGGVDQSVRLYPDAQSAHGDPYARRIDTKYDGLGHVVSRTEAFRSEGQGGVSVQRQFVTATVQYTPSIFNLLPGTNQATLTWNSLAPLGSGDLLVAIDYKTVSGVARTHTSSLLNGDQSAAGTTIKWTALSTSEEEAIGEVTRIRVSKKTIYATWSAVIDQGLGYGANEILIGAPADPQSIVLLETRLAGTTTWAAPPGAGLLNFGSRYRYEASALSVGTHEYRVRVITPGQAERLHATGTVTISKPPLIKITTPIAFGVVKAGALSWAHQDPSVQQVVRYRLANSTQAWSSLAVSTWSLPFILTPDAYDLVDVSYLAGGTYEFELLWTFAGQGVPSHHATGSFTVVPAQAAYTVPAVGLPPITGLQLGTMEVFDPLSWFNVWGDTTTTVPAMLWDACSATLAMYYNGGWISLPIDDGLAYVDQWGQWRGQQRASLASLGYGTWQVEVHVLNGTHRIAVGSYTNASWGRSLTVITPPYTPAYTIPAVPASYSVSVTTAVSSGAISTMDGAIITQSVGLNGGSWSVRPTITQNTDRWGNVTSISDPRSASWMTTYRFNANNQMVQQTQPVASLLGAPVTRIFYDALGRQVAISDANGNVSGKVYDAAGNLLEERPAEPGTVIHTYDALGHRMRTVDGDGHAVNFKYDRMGNLLWVDKGFLPTYRSVLNDAQWQGLINIKDQWTYDQLGQKISYTNGNGEKLLYLYDLRGNVVETQQPMGERTRSAFDAQGRKIGEVDANNFASYWTYDYFGQLADHKDLGAARYSYSYDNARQLIRQTNTGGQNLQYGYDAAGQLTSIADAAIGQTTTYMYDAGGRRIRERVVQQGSTYQDNHLAYDAVGNLRNVADARVLFSMDYDRVGNRTFVGNYVDYQGVAGNLESSAIGRYYKYDRMSRQIVADAINANFDIGVDRGHVISYYANGNRKSDTSWGKKTTTTTGASPILYYNDDSDGTAVHSNEYTYTQSMGWSTEVYRYDGSNRLQSIVRDGVMVNHRRYDGADRLLFSGSTVLPAGYLAVARTNLKEAETDGMEMAYNRYDASGRLMHQRNFNSNWTGRSEISWDVNENIGSNPSFIADGYDNVGNAKGYVIRDLKSNSLTEFSTTFKRFEGHQADVTTGKSTVLNQGSNTQKYDANGFLIGVRDSSLTANDRDFVNDASGRALYVNQGGKMQRQLIVNGEVLGIYGAGLNEKKPRDDNNNPNFANIVDFDFGYAPITSTYPNASPGTYVVRTGDTLQSIAQSAYGDSALWYRIAEANGLVASTDMKVGQTLNIPNRVSTIHNNESTFKPYDPSRITGDLTPNLPMPEEGCGGVGQVLMVIVAVVVSMILGPGVLSAIASSISSQVVGLATGAIDHFSWKAVAISALTPAVGALPAINQIGSAIARAVVTNIATQGVSVAVGLQRRFDWRGVAAAGIGTAVGQTVATATARTDFGFTQAGNQTARQFVATFARGAVAMGVRGGKINAGELVVDAFGNALGSSIAYAMLSPSNSLGEAWGAEMVERKRSLDPLGLKAYAMDAASVMRSAQTLWGAPPAETTSGILSDTSTNAEILESQMHGDDPDGELVPAGGGNVRISSGAGGRTLVNGVSVNERAGRSLQAASDLAGMGEVYRDYRLLGGLMSELQQETTLNKLKGAVQEKLGMMRVLPSPEALGASPSMGADGRSRYNNADLLDRYGDALRKVEMWKQGIIELDTRSMLITSIGTAKLSPADWVAENTRRYANAFAVGVDEGQRRYDAGTLRYPADMPGQLQVGSFADGLARDAVISYNSSIGVPEGPGQLLSMNRWSYDPSGTGAYNRVDLLMDLGPSRNNGAMVLRSAIEGKSSLAAVQSSAGQLQRVYGWVTPNIKTVTPQGVLPWTPQPKRLR